MLLTMESSYEEAPRKGKGVFVRRGRSNRGRCGESREPRAGGVGDVMDVLDDTLLLEPDAVSRFELRNESVMTMLLDGGSECHAPATAIVVMSTWRRDNINKPYP